MQLSLFRALGLVPLLCKPRPESKLFAPFWPLFVEPCSLLLRAAHLQRCRFGHQLGASQAVVFLGLLSLGCPLHSMPTWQWLGQSSHGLWHVHIHFLEEL